VVCSNVRCPNVPSAPSPATPGLPVHSRSIGVGIVGTHGTMGTNLRSSDRQLRLNSPPRISSHRNMKTLAESAWRHAALRHVRWSALRHAFCRSSAEWSTFRGLREGWDTRMAGRTSTPPCPYCQSQATQFVKTEGLEGSVTLFRCAACQKEWSEQVSARTWSKKAQHQTGKPSFTGVADELE
jgi:hypothetical protein